MAAAVVQQSNVNDYLLKKQQESSKELGSEWAELEELHNKKLWHQLTLKLMNFIKKPELQINDNLIQLYNNFIHSFENKIQGNHAQYYRTALRYLGCIELDTLTAEVKVQHAFFLGLAALLGEGVYNLGELLAHPVLESLKSTENAWLVELLYAFNSGNIKKFEAMKPQWEAIADLAAEELFLRQKISLLCLMEMTFNRPSHNRQLTFAEIAKETKLPLNEIELLIMKALSQGLVKGAIDQVANTVNMTWVQPRVLDCTQISNMITRLNDWCKHVDTMEQLLEEKASEILTL
ncbi:unnamed protein product [Diabrotica balteata]|uniref:26S proteasome non-ATPase regulatory subunit 13 n=1 Tax=Diabrotica balteata TaxID=107213 RepID=A0A9P0E2S8_DIABA|nr:unnamed protein product [Diabrotica balteata]